MNKLTLLGATLALYVCGAHAADTAPAATAEAPAAVASAPAQPKQICHKERPTGSDIAKTVCRPADPDPEDTAATDALKRDIQRQSGITDQNRNFHK